MTDKPKPVSKLKVLPFPAAKPEEEMHFDVARVTCRIEDADRAIEFLNKHIEEFPPTAGNLLGLVWAATRTLIGMDIPGEIAGMMVERACNWVSGPAPRGGRKRGG